MYICIHVYKYVNNKLFLIDFSFTKNLACSNNHERLLSSNRCQLQLIITNNKNATTMKKRYNK